MEVKLLIKCIRRNFGENILFEWELQEGFWKFSSIPEMAEWLFFALSFQFYNFYKYTVLSAFFINLVGVSNRELEEFLLSPALPVRRVFRYNRILELPVLPVINKGQHFSDPNGQKFGNSHNPELFQLLIVRLFNS